MKALFLSLVFFLSLVSCGGGGGGGSSSPVSAPPVVVEGTDYSGAYHLEAITCISSVEPYDVTQYATVFNPDANIVISGNSFIEKFNSPSGYVEVHRRAVFNSESLSVEFTQGVVAVTKDLFGEYSDSTTQSFLITNEAGSSITPNPLLMTYTNGANTTGGTEDYYYDSDAKLLFISTSYWISGSSVEDFCFTVFLKE